MNDYYDYNIITKNCEILFSKINSEKLREKRVLITGANGLIGSFIADYLNFLNINHDFKIKIYLTSFSEKEKAERIKHLIKEEEVNYFSWDASTEIEKEKIPKNLDYVFFCSGYGQPAKFTKDVVKTSFINTVGVESLLRNLEQNCNFLFLSTSEVYGEPDLKNIPTKETYNGNYSLENPRASYICSKRLGEIICSAYKQKLKIKICRVGLVYGPGTLSSDQRVLQDFIFKSQKNNEISLLDSGSSIRNYLYITDGVEMMLNILLNSKNNEEIVYNIGGEFEPVSIYELALKVSNLTSCPVKKNENDENTIHKNSPKNVCLSMEKYKKEFPEYGKNFICLNDGIKYVIDWYNFS